MERSALNIFKSEQEIADQIMEGSFRKQKQNEFVMWDKGSEEMEDKMEIKNRLLDEDGDGLYEISDILIGS